MAIKDATHRLNMLLTVTGHKGFTDGSPYFLGLICSDTDYDEPSALQNYARVQLGEMGSSVSGDSTTISNTTQLTFPYNSSDTNWAAVDSFGIWSTVSGGTPIVKGQLTFASGTELEVAPGHVPVFQVGALRLTLDTAQ